MAVFNKLKTVWSIYLVTFACCLFKPTEVHTFHVSNPTFYGNLYDYDLVSEKLSPSDENGLITASELATNLQTKDIMKPSAEIIENTGMNLEYSVFSKIDDTPTTESDGTTKKKLHKTSAIDKFGNDKNLFPLDSPPTTNIDSFDSSDYLSIQFTKMYLKAITALIQHVMDAIFCVNDTTKSTKLPTVTQTNFDDAHDSSPSRKLRKREAFNSGKEPIESKINTNDASMTSKKINSASDLRDVTDKSPETSDMASEVHPGNSEIASSLNLNKITSESHQKSSSLRSSTKSKNEPVSKENLQLPILISPEDNTTTNELNVDTSEQTSMSKNDQGVTADVTGKTTLKKATMWKKMLKHEVDESIESLMNDQNSLLDDLITEQDDYDSNETNLEKMSTHKFSKKAAEGENKTTAESSIFGTIFTITATVVIVIVLAVAGTAVAYQIRKRTLGQNQSGNLNPSRATMA